MLTRLQTIVVETLHERHQISELLHPLKGGRGFLVDAKPTKKGCHLNPVILLIVRRRLQHQ